MVPSNIERPKEYQLVLEEVDQGLYVAQNAYEGQYKYFLKKAKIDRRRSQFSRIQNGNQEIRVIRLSQ